MAKTIKITTGICKLQNVTNKIGFINHLEDGYRSDRQHHNLKNKRKSWLKTVQENRFNRNDKSPLSSENLYEGCRNLSKILNMKEKSKTYND